MEFLSNVLPYGGNYSVYQVRLQGWVDRIPELGTRYEMECNSVDFDKIYYLGKVVTNVLINFCDVS